ncbi:hypothetical protein V7S76_08500 [Aquirufa sp. ROCK2-A2]
MENNQLLERIFSVGNFSNLHPLFVHFPVGILLLLVFFTFLPTSKKSDLQLAMKYLAMAGSFFSFLSCLSGYLLAQSDEYKQSILVPHQWLGMTTFIIFTTVIFIPKWQKILLAFGGVVLLITLYLGTILTHGSFKIWKEKTIQAIQEIIQQPVPSKEKVTIAATPNAYIQPLLEEEIQTKKSFSPVPEQVIKDLKNQGIVAQVLDSDTQQLSINFVNAKKIDVPMLDQLLPFKDQIKSIRIHHLALNNDVVSRLVEFSHLEILQLPDTQLTDEQVSQLAQLPNLQQLNLYNNPITDKSLLSLQQIHSLKKLYVWQTKMSQTALSNLQKKLPQAYIEGGLQQLTKPDSIKK